MKSENSCRSVHGSDLSTCQAESILGDIMASADVLAKRFYSFGKMYSHDLREQSFVDWPFREDCNCTPGKV